MHRQEIMTQGLSAIEHDANAQLVAKEAKEKLFALGEEGYNILFADAVDHVGAKLVAHAQIFGNHQNHEHLKCVYAVIALLGYEDFNTDAAKELVRAIHAKDQEAELSALVEAGIDPQFAYFDLLGTLEYLLY